MDKDTFLSTERLYHFTKRCRALDILKSSKLLFSKLERMNDINESYRQIFTMNGIEPADVEKELAKYKQISLTHDNRFSGFSIPSMWGHYADKGYGVCLVFDKAKLLRKIPDECYKNNISYSLDYNSDIVIKGDLRGTFDTHIYDLFFTKTLDWEHEQEYRILTKNDDSIDIEGCVIAIVMCIVNGVAYGDSIWGADDVDEMKKKFPEIPILEFNYWSGQSILRDENSNQWYPPKDYTIDTRLFQ